MYSHEAALSELEIAVGLFSLFYLLVEIGKTVIIQNSKSIFKKYREQSLVLPHSFTPPPVPRSMYRNHPQTGTSGYSFLISPLEILR